jgi:hypothetical protein
MSLSRHSPKVYEYESLNSPVQQQIRRQPATNPGIQNGIYTVCLVSSLLLSTARWMWVGVAWEVVDGLIWIRMTSL